MLANEKQKKKRVGQGLTNLQVQREMGTKKCSSSTRIEIRKITKSEKVCDSATELSA